MFIALWSHMEIHGMINVLRVLFGVYLWSRFAQSEYEKSALIFDYVLIWMEIMKQRDVIRWYCTRKIKSNHTNTINSIQVTIKIYSLRFFYCTLVKLYIVITASFGFIYPPVGFNRIIVIFKGNFFINYAFDSCVQFQQFATFNAKKNVRCISMLIWRVLFVIIICFCDINSTIITILPYSHSQHNRTMRIIRSPLFVLCLSLFIQNISYVVMTVHSLNKFSSPGKLNVNQNVDSKTAHNVKRRIRTLK